MRAHRCTALCTTVHASVPNEPYHPHHCLPCFPKPHSQRLGLHDNNSNGKRPCYSERRPARYARYCYPSFPLLPPHNLTMLPMCYGLHLHPTTHRCPCRSARRFTALSTPAIAHHERNLTLQLQRQTPPTAYASTAAY